MHKVYPAEPYDLSRLGSRGDASRMLLRQFRFPDEYEERESVIQADSDRLEERERDFMRACYEKHAGHVMPHMFESWVKRAKDKAIMAFLREALKVEQRTVWTGYRITATVNWGNGHTMYSFELFRKHPQSATVVYTGGDAPNVLPGRRYPRET